MWTKSSRQQFAVYQSGRWIASDGRGNGFLMLPAVSVRGGELLRGSVLALQKVDGDEPPVVLSVIRLDSYGELWCRDEGAEVSMLYAGKWIGTKDGLDYAVVPAASIVDGRLVVGYALQAWSHERSPVAVAVWWEGSSCPSFVDPVWHDGDPEYAEEKLLRATKVLEDPFNMLGVREGLKQRGTATKKF